MTNAAGRCECTIELSPLGEGKYRQTTYKIAYCPLHASAPELLEIAKEAYEVSRIALAQGHPCGKESKRLGDIISRATPQKEATK